MSSGAQAAVSPSQQARGSVCQRESARERERARARERERERVYSERNSITGDPGSDKGDLSLHHRESLRASPADTIRISAVYLLRGGEELARAPDGARW